MPTPHRRHWIEPFEIEVLRISTSGGLPAEVLDVAIAEGEFVEYDYNGYGYYLTFRHPQIPSTRSVYNEAALIGECNGIEAGFVVFVEANEIMLECFPFDETSIPADFREQQVRIRSI